MTCILVITQVPAQLMTGRPTHQVKPSKATYKICQHSLKTFQFRNLTTSRENLFNHLKTSVTQQKYIHFTELASTCFLKLNLHFKIWSLSFNPFSSNKKKVFCWPFGNFTGNVVDIIYKISRYSRYLLFFISGIINLQSFDGGSEVRKTAKTCNGLDISFIYWYR